MALRALPSQYVLSSLVVVVVVVVGGVCERTSVFIKVSV